MIGKKTVAAALLLPLSLQASTITLSVHQGKQTGPCTELVERFLSEYREIIPHSRIILDGPGSQSTDEDHFELSCDGGEERIVLKNDGGESHTLRYQRMAQSFDAADWVPLQKRMRETGLAALAPTETAAKEASMPQTRPGHGTSAKGEKSWWPWVVIGVLGAGAAATAAVLLTRDPGHTHVSTR